MKTTTKNITIFSETSIWQGNNITNKTYYDPKINKYIKTNKLKIEKPNYINKNKPAWGKLWQYVSHTMESKIFAKIIRYIQKNSKRITFIGVDNDTLARDYEMYKIISNNLNKNNINFFWAHNAHIDDRQLSYDNLKWIKSYSNIKYFCGHYLKEKYGNKYCIILTQSYSGVNRFNSFCEGDGCEKRTWFLSYFYKPFAHEPNKKFINNNKDLQFFNEFNSPLIEFSNSYYKKNKFGYQDIIYNSKYDFIIFWNRVNELEPYFNYK
jgi:erythromycin esterase-like protein